MKLVSFWLFILQTDWGWITGTPFREWCVFGAELLVALVIYLEVSHSRSTDFLEKATNNKSNEDRRNIYNEFLKLDGDLDARAETFCAMIMTPKYEWLKHTCERQIALFNDLGFSCRKPFWSLRGRLENPLVSLLPHATIYIWVIMKPYILRRRADTGPWYSAPLLRFAERSANFVLRYKRGLAFRMEDGSGGIEISMSQLEQIREDLKTLRKNRDPERSMT